MSQPLTLDALEAALRSIGAVGQSATLFQSTCSFTIRLRDPNEGPLAPLVAITGQGPTLDAAVVDALRKIEVRR